MTEVQERLDLLYRLQRKYGSSEEAVLAYLAQAKEQQEQLQDLDNRIANAQKELASITAELTSKAKALTDGFAKTECGKALQGRGDSHS